MRTHTFTLILTGYSGDLSLLEDDLYRAGCDDALLLFRDGLPCLDFDREADTLLEALISAIHDVRRGADGLDVLRAEPDDLVTAADIARRLRRSKESVRLLIAGKRGPGGFPAPVRGIGHRTRIWRWAEVAAWLAGHGFIEVSQDELVRANTIAAVNAALGLRRTAPDSANDLLERLAG
jgi:hypothetical protein